ncbi:restriction endonuclease [Janthinobacterium sp. J1-1]|uniref:restriction endonuclease n=1 Tax=Janthinobacterium sp. J1-1 TaxID=3065910 RepID=UPI0035B100A5
MVHGADGGVIVTCGAFTKEARSFASHAGIVLVDGFELLRMRHSPGFSLPVSPVLASGAPVAPENTDGCPNCGVIMIRRSARSGRSAGRQFLGCANYPVCCGTRPL